MMKRNVKIGIGLVLLLIIFVLFVSGRFISEPPELQIQTQPVTRQDLLEETSATGTINPRNVVEVGTQVSGTIAEITVDYNDRVEKGQVLTRLDTRTLEAQVKESQAAVNRTKAQFEQVEWAYERAQKLYDKNVYSEEDLEKAKVDYESAKAGYESARIQLERTQVNMDFAIITSPVEGVVLSRNVDVGQTVAASFSTPTLFTLASSLENMQIEADVGEADIGTVQVGQRVQFSVDAWPEETFTGEVRQIRLQPQSSQNVVTYTVIIDIQNPDLKLLPGMTAYVNIIRGGVENVLAVPGSAISQQLSAEQAQSLRAQGFEINRTVAATSRPEQNAAYVWIKNDNMIGLRMIQTGFSDGVFTEVVSGLEEGEEVILNIGQRQTMIRPGTQGSRNTRNPLSPPVRVMRQN